MSSPLKKPNMRGMQVAYLKKHLIGMLVFSGSLAMTYKTFVMDARRKKYEEFYKTYDPVKRLKIMNDAGLMQSCPK